MNLVSSISADSVYFPIKITYFRDCCQGKSRAFFWQRINHGSHQKLLFCLLTIFSRVEYRWSTCTFSVDLDMEKKNYTHQKCLRTLCRHFISLYLNYAKKNEFHMIQNVYVMMLWTIFTFDFNFIGIQLGKPMIRQKKKEKIP